MISTLQGWSSGNFQNYCYKQEELNLTNHKLNLQNLCSKPVLLFITWAKTDNKQNSGEETVLEFPFSTKENCLKTQWGKKKAGAQNEQMGWTVTWDKIQKNPKALIHSHKWKKHRREKCCTLSIGANMKKSGLKLSLSKLGRMGWKRKKDTGKQSRFLAKTVETDAEVFF